MHNFMDTHNILLIMEVDSSEGVLTSSGDNEDFKRPVAPIYETQLQYHPYRIKVKI